MIRKKYMWKAFLSAGVFCLLLLTVVVGYRKRDLNQIMFYCMGGGAFVSDGFLQTMLLGLIPSVFVLFLFSDYLSCDFDSMAAYVFTRTNRYGAYFVQKLFYLAACLLVYTLLCVLCSFLIGLPFGVTVQNLDHTHLAWEASLFFLQYFTLIFLINLLSLKAEPHHSFFIVTFLYIASVLITPFLSGDAQEILYYINPLGQGIYAWRREAAVFLEQGACGLAPVWYSYAYFGVFLVLEGFLLYRFVKKADFL